MSEGDTIRLRFDWAQMGTQNVIVSFFPLGSGGHVAELTVTPDQRNTVALIRELGSADNSIELPASFLDPATKFDERLDMFREALFKAADGG